MTLKKIFFSLPFISLTCAAAFIIIGFTPPFQSIEYRFLDLHFKIRGPVAPHPDIAIIEVNDNSLSREGIWPWPRDYHARLLDILRPYQPSLIFLDMLFTEQSNPEGDRAFAAALAKSGNVILPFYFKGNDPGHLKRNQAILPLSEFLSAAKSAAFVNIFPDHDGHVRKTQWTAREGNEVFLHSSTALAAVYQNYTQTQLGELLSTRAFFINFPGPFEVFPRIPYDAVLEDAQLPEVRNFLESLRGKIVLAGINASGAGMDMKPTAYSALYPGLGIQASALHSLLTGTAIRQIPFFLHGLLLAAACYLILRISFACSPTKAFFYCAAAMILIFFVIQLCFQLFYVWTPFFSFFLLSSLCFTVSQLWQFVGMRIEKEVLLRELDLAARIQNSFMPTEAPEIPGFEIHAFNHPAKHVGGDLYDILRVNEKEWVIYTGDVSGKGVPAALFMAKSISDIRRLAHLSPHQAVEGLNNSICQTGPSGIFLTLVFLNISPAERIMTIANAGHEPVFYYHKEKNAVAPLSNPEGMPLGVLEDNTYPENTFYGKAGDFFVLTSDGIKEAMNMNREQFGWERLKKSILENADKNPREIIAGLLKDIRKFTAHAPQHDDMTIVCGKFI